MAEAAMQGTILIHTNTNGTAFGSNVGFSILPKDTRTGETGDRTADLLISGRLALLPDIYCRAKRVNGFTVSMF